VDSSTDTEDYQEEPSERMTAWHPTKVTSDGRRKVMTMEEYCDFYGLDRTKVSSHKLVSHTGVPYYNIVYRQEFMGMTRADVLNHIQEEMQGFQPRRYFNQYDGRVVAAHAISDIHLGLQVKKDEVLRQEHYNVKVACQKLADIAAIINGQGNDINHVILNGDILEAVQLMHISQYREIDADLTGVKGIKTATQILHEFLLNRIENIGKIYLPSSNHGRLGGSNKDENQRGEAEHFIAWALHLMGYDTEYAELIGRFKLEDVTILYTHGHLGVAKKSTPSIIQEFSPGDASFHCVVSGHTHDAKAKGADHSIIRESKGGYIHLVCPAIATGNEYSANLGNAGTNSGFITIWPSRGKVKFMFETV